MFIKKIKNKLKNEEMDEYQRLARIIELERREEWEAGEKRLARKIGLVK